MTGHKIMQTHISWDWMRYAQNLKQNHCNLIVQVLLTRRILMFRSSLARHAELAYHTVPVREVPVRTYYRIMPSLSRKICMK
jgi:hypothetical protein